VYMNEYGIRTSTSNGGAAEDGAVTTVSPSKLAGGASLCNAPTKLKNDADKEWRCLLSSSTMSALLSSSI